MQAKNLAVPDFHDGGNSLFHGPSVPGMVSFRVEWSKAADHVHHAFGNAEHKWTAEMVLNSATCAWSGETALASFHTTSPDPASYVLFAEVGHERSGVFFG